MKSKLLLIFSLFLINQSTAQDAKKIFQRCYDKCRNIQNGFYEVSRLMKFMPNKDTLAYSYTCKFKKANKDTLFSFLFYMKQMTWRGPGQDVLYTGNELVWMTAKDSAATIIPQSEKAKYIQNVKHNYTFYSPFLDQKGLPHDSELDEASSMFLFIGKEKIRDIDCLHLRKREEAKGGDKTMQFLRSEYDLWVRKDDSLPIQYTSAVDVIINKDTNYQFEKMTLTKYEINNMKDESGLSLQAVPSFYRMKNISDTKPGPILKTGSKAPKWEIIDLRGESYSSPIVRGKIVLMDFMYKSCYPCMKTIPALDALYEKYASKGLVIIGLDPNDKKEDLLDKKSSTSTAKFHLSPCNPEIVQSFQVTSFPTLYLIDKNGTIIFGQEGYNDITIKKLEEIIQNNL